MSIEVKGVTFSHDDTPDDPLLSIPQWRVSTGERVFVHGPSGSGKSTLLNLISGLLDCKQGEITVVGERLDRMSRRQRDRFRANHIGYVFQSFNLIPYLNALENIELARSFATSNDKTETSASWLLEALNVDRSDWDRPTSALSMGQQQRVAIARALVNQPELLIADEPTSSLDQQNRDGFLALLLPLLAEHNMTLLFVSHDMTLAQHFDRVQPLSDISEVA